MISTAHFVLTLPARHQRVHLRWLYRRLRTTLNIGRADARFMAVQLVFLGSRGKVEWKDIL